MEKIINYPIPISVYRKLCQVAAGNMETKAKTVAKALDLGLDALQTEDELTAKKSKLEAVAS